MARILLAIAGGSVIDGIEPDQWLALKATADEMAWTADQRSNLDRAFEAMCPSSAHA